MKFLRLKIFPLVLLVASSAVAQSGLPQCPSDANVAWNNCEGTITSPNGDKYVGEFRDGKQNGHGSILWANGTKYVGEFKDGVTQGLGTLMWPDGRKYIGEFRDGKMSGKGNMFAADGRPQAQPTLGTQPPSADYVKAQISARYEQCNSNAEARYTANWDDNCHRIQEREQTNYQNCLERNPGTQYRNGPANCAHHYLTTTDCRSLPVLLADSLKRDLMDVQARCLRDFESGIH